MSPQRKKPELEKLWKALDKYKYVLLLVAMGLLLLLWPTGEKHGTREGSGAAEASEFDLDALEEKLSRTLSHVEGAGEVTVLLTLDQGEEQVPLTDRSTSVDERGSSVEEKPVVVSTGSGTQTVERLRRCPEFRGAVVVCQGADRAEVRLLLTQAVSSLTGLGADRITVCKGG